MQVAAYSNAVWVKVVPGIPKLIWQKIMKLSWITATIGSKDWELLTSHSTHQCFPPLEVFRCVCICLLLDISCSGAPCLCRVPYWLDISTSSITLVTLNYCLHDGSSPTWQSGNVTNYSTKMKRQLDEQKNKIWCPWKLLLLGSQKTETNQRGQLENLTERHPQKWARNGLKKSWTLIPGKK